MDVSAWLAVSSGGTVFSIPAWNVVVLGLKARSVASAVSTDSESVSAADLDLCTQFMSVTYIWAFNNP